MNPLHLGPRIGSGFASRLRNLWFRALGVHITGYVWMRCVSIPRQWGDITLEQGVALDDGVVILSSGTEKPNKLIIRHGTYINRYTMVDVHERIEIGRDCMIGPHCYITDGNHGISPDRTIKSQAMTSNPVIIEDEVWIGAGVTVLPGVRLGRGSVIGAGAVVTKDVPAHAIHAGVPAVKIGHRMIVNVQRAEVV